MIKKYFALTLISASLLAAAGCSSDDDDDDDAGTTTGDTTGGTTGGTTGATTGGDASVAVLPDGSAYDPAALEPPATLSLAELVAATEVLSSLGANVGGCDFAGALSDADARLTVFAPTNDAFAAQEVTDALGAGADVCDVIGGHVLVGAVATAADLIGQDGTSATTLARTEVSIAATAAGDGVLINGVEVVLADQFATNGVAHVIGAVLLPESDDGDTGGDDTGETDDTGGDTGATGGSLLGPGIDAANAAGLTSFTAVWDQGGFGTGIEDNPWTIFASSNDALDDVDSGSTQPASNAFLQDYIATTGGFSPAELLAAGSITTNAQNSFTVGGTEDALLVNGNAAAVIYEGPNGSVVYSLDGLLQP